MTVLDLINMLKDLDEEQKVIIGVGTSYSDVVKYSIKDDGKVLLYGVRYGCRD